MSTLFKLTQNYFEYKGILILYGATDKRNFSEMLNGSTFKLTWIDVIWFDFSKKWDLGASSKQNSTLHKLEKGDKVSETAPITFST